jgi:hypothetical protein
MPRLLVAEILERCGTVRNDARSSPLTMRDKIRSRLAGDGKDKARTMRNDALVW